MVKLTLLHDNLNESEAMRREYVATGYVVHQDQVLLIWHRELHQWLPPGGHIELNELPDDAVVREILEETDEVAQEVFQDAETKVGQEAGEAFRQAVNQYNERYQRALQSFGEGPGGQQRRAAEG